ncbi:hypothetical protein GCM10027514_31180 [Azotobacter armeniacus]
MGSHTLLSATKGIPLTRTPHCRRFVEAVLWILRRLAARFASLLLEKGMEDDKASYQHLSECLLHAWEAR